MQRLLTIKFSNLLASPLYANIEAKRHNAQINYGLIFLDGVEAGIALRLTKTSLGGIVSHQIMHRTPLWFDGFNTNHNNELFWYQIKINKKNKFLNSHSLIPENDHACMVDWFKPINTIEPYQTIYLDLEKSEAELKQTMRKTWRNDLQKAIKSDINIEVINDLPTLKMLIARSDLDRKIKHYKAPARKYLDDLCSHHYEHNAILGIVAKYRNEMLAGIIVLIHGASATYQLSYSSDKGKQMHAPKLLLWQAVKMLKAQNIMSLDLGGIHNNAPSLTVFKKGIGGIPYKTGGLYV